MLQPNQIYQKRLSQLANDLFDDFVIHPLVSAALVGSEIPMSEPEVVELFAETFPWLDLAPTSTWVNKVNLWVKKQKAIKLSDEEIQKGEDGLFKYVCQHELTKRFFDQRSAGDEAIPTEALDLLSQILPDCMSLSSRFADKFCAYLSQPIDYSVKLYKNKEQYDNCKPELALDGFAFEEDAISEANLQLGTGLFYAVKYESGCFNVLETIFQESTHES